MSAVSFLAACGCGVGYLGVEDLDLISGEDLPAQGLQLLHTVLRGLSVRTHYACTQLLCTHTHAHTHTHTHTHACAHTHSFMYTFTYAI